MSKTRFAWKVGLFVFISLVLLAGLLLEFSKGLTFFRPTYDILLRAENAGSLKLRAYVLVSGVQVGSISDIKLDPSGRFVTLTLRIFDQYRIFEDARFVIEQSGFLGDQYIAIIPTKNEGKYYGPGRANVAKAEPPFNLQEFTRSASGFVTRIDEAAKRLNDSLVDVGRLVLNPETLTNISVTAANLRVISQQARGTLDRIDQVVATNGPAVTYAATNLAAFSDGLNRFAGALNDLLATNAPQVNAAVSNVESSTESLKGILADVRAGKGLAGDLLKNEELAGKMSEIVSDLSITSSNLNRLGLWGILWQHKPPKTNAPAPRSLTTPKAREE